MSDDEGPRGGKGGKGKGGGKGGGKAGGDGGGGPRGGGGSRGGKGGKGGGGGGGISVSRLKVVPKFLQEIQQRFKPPEAKRGLNHAKLEDKASALGRNDDDEYDDEDATWTGDFTAEELAELRYQRRSRTGITGGGAASGRPQPRAFFAAEAPREEDASAGEAARFRSRAARTADAAGAAASGAGKEGDEPLRVRVGAKARTNASQWRVSPVEKKQRLSFDDE